MHRRIRDRCVSARSVPTRRGRFERLEPRLALASHPGEATPAAALDLANWFQPLDWDLFAETTLAAFATSQVAGPTPRLAMLEPLQDRWLVQLSQQAMQESSSIAAAAAKLRTEQVSLRVVRGLGAPGLFLIETAADAPRVEAAFAANPNVDLLEPDLPIQGQRLPDDPEFEPDRTAQRRPIRRPGRCRYRRPRGLGHDDGQPRRGGRGDRFGHRCHTSRSVPEHLDQPRRDPPRAGRAARATSTAMGSSRSTT